MLRTFTIVTTTANRDMAALHERMPVVLEQSYWPTWLGKQPGDDAGLLRPAAARVVRLWPVSRAVNSVRNNGPKLLTEVEESGPQTPAKAAVDLNPA